MENDGAIPNNIETPPKAYRNPEFLNSTDGRIIRVLCEFEEPARRFRKHDINKTIVFFGSARTPSPETAKANLEAARVELARDNNPSAEVQQAFNLAKRDVAMSEYYRDAMKLSERLTEWTLATHAPDQQYAICCGGGPGIMEAANRGSYNTGGKSVGLNISLPFEQSLNPYQTPELAMEFHYFFIRKFWFLYLSRAMVVFPGGFGTFDEFFELLTLVQTGKNGRKVPIVLFGSDFWNKIINFEGLVEWGVISPEDLDLFKVCDDVDVAFEYLKAEMVNGSEG